MQTLTRFLQVNKGRTLSRAKNIAIKLLHIIDIRLNLLINLCLCLKLYIKSNFRRVRTWSTVLYFNI